MGVVGVVATAGTHKHAQTLQRLKASRSNMFGRECAAHCQGRIHMYVYVYDTAGCGRMRCSLRRPARMCRRSVRMNVPVECVLFSQENVCCVACALGRMCPVFFLLYRMCSMCVRMRVPAGLAGGASVCAANAGLRMCSLKNVSCGTTTRSLKNLFSVKCALCRIFSV
jgi:hypothetical protein